MRHTSLTPNPEANHKSKVAEALFNSDTPTDVIMWALSHLPDINKTGNKIAEKYNHDSNKLSEALGFTSRKWLQYSNKLTKLVMRMSKEEMKPSVAVQETLPNFEEDYQFRKFVYSMLLVMSFEKAKEDTMKQIVLEQIVKEMKTKIKKKK